MHYFEFHFQKIIAATKGWSDELFGAYVKLLIEQFDRGYVPDDPEELSMLITSYRRNWPRLKKKFTEPSEPGQLRNAFMCGIREKALEQSAKNSVAGKISAEKKKRAKSARSTGVVTGVEQPNQRDVNQPITNNHKPIKEKIEKENWNQYPTAETPIELTEAEVQVAIEFLYRLGKPLLTPGRVLDFWGAFRLNLSGDFYQDRGHLIQHFRNWLKDRDLSERNQEQLPAVRSVIENRNNAILDQFS